MSKHMHKMQAMWYVAYHTSPIAIIDLAYEDLECMLSELSRNTKPAHPLGRGRSYSDNQNITFKFTSIPDKTFTALINQAKELGCKVFISKSDTTESPVSAALHLPPEDTPPVLGDSEDQIKIAE